MAARDTSPLIPDAKRQKLADAVAVISSSEQILSAVVSNEPVTEHQKLEECKTENIKDEEAPATNSMVFTIKNESIVPSDDKLLLPSDDCAATGTEAHNISDEEEEDEDRDEDEGLLEEYAAVYREILGGIDTKYNSAVEDKALPGFHEAIPWITNACTEMLGAGASILQLAEYQDKDTAELMRDLRAAIKLKTPRSRKIGLLGNSGVGKSSLINCILDTPGLAHEGAGGACTSTIVEYHSPFGTQTSPFSAEIKFCDPHQRREILAIYLRNYVDYHCTDVAMLSHDEREDAKILADTARDGFMALFADRAEFKTLELAEGYLKSANPEDCHVLLQQLWAWTEDIVTFHNSGRGIVEFGADSVEQLAALLEPFVTTPPSDRPIAAPWPIVQLVRIGLESAFLQNGVVLADLPGLADVNKTRTRATQVYQRECDFLFVVGAILRVESDEAIRQHMIKSSRILGKNLALVCTKLDNDLGKGRTPRDFNASESESGEYSRLMILCSNVAEEIRLAEVNRKKLKKIARQTAALRINSLKFKQAVLTKLIAQSLVKIRISKTTSAMQRIYRESTHELNVLKVYCVSNTDYARHVSGYNETNLPYTLQVTGIPALRICALSLPSTDKFTAIRQHWQITVPALITKLEMWCQQSSMVRRMELRTIFEQPYQDSDKVIEHLIEALNKNLQDLVLHSIDSSRPRWIAKAQSIAVRWIKQGAKQYSTRCKHGGAGYGKKAAETISWNDELIESVEEDLRSPWDMLEAAAAQTTRRFIDDCIRLLDNVRTEAKDFSGADAASIRAFTKSLGSKKHAIFQFAGTIEKDILAMISDRKHESTTAMADSFLEAAMENVYDDCLGVKAPNLAKQQQQIMHKAMSLGRPYQDIGPKTKELFTSYLLERKSEYSRMLQELFMDILKDFDRSFKVEEIADPNRDTLHSAIRSFVAEAKQALQGPIREQLQRAVTESFMIPSEDIKEDISVVDLFPALDW